MKQPLILTNFKWDDPTFATKTTAVTILGSGKRTYQLDVLPLFEDSRLSRLVAPCGSGKSTTQVALAILDVIDSGYERLQLFVMPQTHISNGFFRTGGKYKNISIHGTVYTVAVTPDHNFCEEASVKQLKKLLLTDRAKLAKLCKGKRLTGLFAMTSNAALALAWKSMSSSEKAKAVRNLHIRFDESHHVTDDNNLGKILRYVIEHGDDTSRVTLTTATDFRGDYADTIPVAFQKLFAAYRLSWLKHWVTLGIRKMIVSYDLFKGDPIDMIINNICAEKGEKHLIAVPPSNTGWVVQYGGKDKAVAELKKRLLAKWTGVRFCDTATSAIKDSEKAKLLLEPSDGEKGDGRKSSAFDVTLTCMVLREGTDWCPCSRLHVTYPEGSPTLAVQTIGRLLRRYTSVEGKKKNEVRAHYYYPNFPKPKDGMSKDELLDLRKNVMLVMMQIEDTFYPILFPLLPRVNSKSKSGGDGSPNYGSLEDVIGCTPYRKVVKAFVTELLELEVTGTLTKAKFLSTIHHVLAPYKKKLGKYYDKAVETLEVIWARHANPRFRGMNITWLRKMGFDRLYAKVTANGRTLLGRYDCKIGRKLQAKFKSAWDANIGLLKKLIKSGKVKSVADLDKYPDLKAWAFAANRMATKAGKPPLVKK